MSKPFISPSGTKEWFNSEGKYHRVGGPAIEWVRGNKWWFVDGKLHRLDGPAIEGFEYYTGWFIDNIEVSEADYPQAVLLYKCRMVLEG